MINTAVLLSTYNGGKFLSQQLDSIFNQTYSQFTLYIRDDGSTDNTLEILNDYSSKYENIVILNDEKNNIGAPSSFLCLLKCVDAKYYMFCDQDDVWLENKIEVQVENIEKSNYNQNLPIVVFHDLILTNSDGIVIKESFWDLQNFQVDKIGFESVFVKNNITGCTCLINQSMKNEILKFNVNSVLMHDHIIALIAYGYGKAISIKKGLILYRDHSNSVTPKRSISFSYRISNFFKNINRGEYLMGQIFQLEEYLKNYESFLNEKYFAKAKTFVSLRYKRPIIRFIYLKTFFNI
jgi:glycosyltransferase involved in cell wall biosynthesis